MKTEPTSAALPRGNFDTAARIYESYEKRVENELPRLHLGPSQIGKECERAIWYGFRWVGAEKFEGRMLRLFERGKREELWVIEDLRAVGCTVHELDENGKQFSFDEGHWQGSVDGVVEGLPESPKTPHLLEVKTHSLKSFEWLKKNGVKKGKPEHYAQVQVYMDKLKLTRCLYVAVCKDNDEIYIERIRFDAESAEHYDTRALRVITSPVPSPRLEDRQGFACTYCSFRKSCLGAELPKLNCRTCVHSTPSAGGGWHCAEQDMGIPTATTYFGCEKHLFIPDLLKEGLEIVGADNKGITYLDPSTGTKLVNLPGSGELK